VTTNKIGRRLKSLPFEKGSTGSSKPWAVKEEHRELLLRKYVPVDERDDGKLKQQSIDSDPGQIVQNGQEYPWGSPPEPSRPVTLDEKVTTIRNLVSKRPITMEGIEKCLPDHYLAALKLRENGELATRPDGTLEARP
jgi:hypothetical protein